MKIIAIPSGDLLEVLELVVDALERSLPSGWQHYPETKVRHDHALATARAAIAKVTTLAASKDG